MHQDLKSLIRAEVECALTSIFGDAGNAPIARNALNEEYLEEGGYAKLVRSIAGLEPNIDSIGIITAENPMAQQATTKSNKERNKQLASDLRDLGYGFYQISGRYGNVEHPYVVPNISKEDIIKLGREYEQDSVIYVEKTEEGSLAQMIETHGDEASVKSRVVLPLASDVEDFYSLYKGRKFVIPFFDDIFQDKALEKGRIVQK